MFIIRFYTFFLLIYCFNSIICYHFTLLIFNRLLLSITIVLGIIFGILIHIFHHFTSLFEFNLPNTWKQLAPKKRTVCRTVIIFNPLVLLEIKNVNFLKVNIISDHLSDQIECFDPQRSLSCALGKEIVNSVRSLYLKWKLGRHRIIYLFCLFQPTNLYLQLVL